GNSMRPVNVVDVVVERERADASCPEPGGDLLLGFEIVGLVAQVKSRVRRQFRPQSFQHIENAACIVGIAQSRLPRPCHAVKDGRYAVGDGLSIALQEGDVQGKMHPRTRHHLALESIAMDIDDAGKNEQPFCIDATRALRSIPSDPAVCGYVEIALDEDAIAQYTPAFDPQTGLLCALVHVSTTALPGSHGSPPPPPAAPSYFSRNASAERARKSPSAACSRSWPQSHHATRSRRAAMEAGNRSRTRRAGLPATTT